MRFLICALLLCASCSDRERVNCHIRNKALSQLQTENTTQIGGGRCG